MRNAEQIMFSIKKWIFRPKKSDNSQLAQFFYADEELNLVAAELDSFDGRKDPERCTALVNQLRLCQDKVLTIIEKIMCEVIPTQRANRDFRVKFPDDVLQESLAGQLWFGAECLAAGSSIMNREVESASMRPLAKALTRHLDFLRSSLRDQCLKNQNSYTDKITNTLMVFDRLFAEFELSYVSAMVPVKTMKEYDLLQEVAVLFCETVQRATRLKLLTQNQIDDYDPALMFTIPRLAIVSGLLVYPEGPLNPDMDPMNMSEMFRPFQTLLYKIRELLWTLSREELWLLEKSLCSTDDPSFNARLTVEDKLNSINSDCDSNQGLSLRSDNQVEEGSVYSGESCVMSHSVSTNTIVSHADAASNDMDSSSQFSRVDESPAERDSASEDSSQEDDASDDHLQDEAGCSSVGTRRLRHSQSWPEASKRPARNRRLPPEGDTLENDCGSSMEILEDIGVEHQPLARCTHSTGSREFCFHLPRNTGQDTGPTAAFPAIPSSTEASSGQTSQQIIITEESVLSQDSEHHEDGHISFVTDALNQVFLTDPNFKGVLVSDWNQRPPRCSRESCTKSCDENCKGGFQCPNTESEERGASPPNVEQGGDEVCSDNCDKCSSSCNKRSPCRSSASDAVQKGKALKRESADPSEKEINKNCKRRSRKARLVDYENKPNTDSLAVPKLHRGKPSEQLNSSRSHSPSVDYDWDRESYSSSETSSYNSDSHDDEEIALAIQAAELAARQEARGRFKSSSDLIHRLFVCISGVADQLQTNYASDLRHILKTVFDCAASETLDEVEEANEKTCADVADMSDSTDSDDDEYVTEEDGNQNRHHNSTSETDPPEWMPDGESPHCMACKVPFTFVRRRHHCRNCGKIFCGRCSSNSVPLPHYGHSKPVRICNHCYVFQVTPFTVN